VSDILCPRAGGARCARARVRERERDPEPEPEPETDPESTTDRGERDGRDCARRVRKASSSVRQDSRKRGLAR
jgi:hypothetical protein